ncbi:MAG: nucleotidyltransferase domain-containing protein [Nanoarchaeota archaeon]
MDRYKVNLTSLSGDVFRLLCINAGEELSQRRIAEILKISPTASATAVRMLEKSKFVKVERSKHANVRLVSLNRNDVKTIFLKRAENLRQIYESGLVLHLSEKFPGAAIILFGSYSRGEDIASSDIDIAILSAKEKEVELSLFEKILGRKISLQFYENLGSVHKNLRENLINGIVLYGIVEL